MKVITLFLAILLSVSPASAQKGRGETGKPVRQICLLNEGWTFNYFPAETADRGYEQAGFNDSRWPAVSLPHTWNSFETSGEKTPFTRSPGENGDLFWWSGWGWYRKHFRFTGPTDGKSISLEFEGVQKFCRIWVNGIPAGEHKGGCDRFDTDITKLVKPGDDNLVAIAVSNLQKEEYKVHPLSEGAFNISCGITGSIRLVVRNSIFIPMQGSASHEGGTHILAGTGSHGKGDIKIRTWVRNDLDIEKTVTLQSSVEDMQGKVLRVVKSELTLSPGETGVAEQAAGQIENVRTWSPGDPYLYKLISEVIDKKEVTDSLITGFGFRSVATGAAPGSLLFNGEELVFTGLRAPVEYPWLGNALPGWIITALCPEGSRTGPFNLLRTVAAPGSSHLLGTADERGVAAEEDLGVLTDAVYTPEEQKAQLTAVVRRDRNHPSLIGWILPEGIDAKSIFPFTEDSTRSLRALIPGLPGTFVPGKLICQGPDIPGGEAVPSVPARLVLRVSHSRVAAGRGTIVAVEALIADSAGHIVPGLDNCIHWRINGPGSFVGPAIYTSYKDSLKSSLRGYYVTTPAINLIRSSGKAGKITVSVFASGLASGTAEIEVTDSPAGACIISETTLADEGRRPVSGSRLLSARLDETPVVIKPSAADFVAGPADSSTYRLQIRRYMLAENPQADSSSVEFDALVSLFTVQLMNCRGRISAEDYTFSAGQYNTCSLISGYVLRTKLPPLFKEKLRKYYADVIIRRGLEKSPGDEMNWLNWIPSGGMVVIVPASPAAVQQKGVITVRNTDLAAIITAVYPQFSKFSEEARVRALQFIARMNPAVSQVNDPSRAGSVAELHFIAEKNEPVLIPEFKFISE